MALSLKQQVSLIGHKKSTSLDRKLNLGETLIQYALILCAVISILVTVGILVVLGGESAKFFTSQLWRDSNKTVTLSLDATQTFIETSNSGQAFEEGLIIRIENEKMLILAMSPGQDRFQVQRGYQDTLATSHAEGRSLYREENPTLIEFFTSTTWQPRIGEFGILPLLTATLMVSFIAILVALPLGLASAIYLSEYARPRVRNVIKPLLEVLAGIPTVVFGFFALTFMTPLLQAIFGPQVSVYNTASAGIVVGILIIPLIASMAEDALSAVPKSLKEASYGLGATRLETSIKVVLPAAFSGVVAAFIVGVSRAIGETMVVAIAAGSGPKFTLNPFESAETMTGHIARISGGDLSYDSIDYTSIFAIGLTLFILTLTLNVIARQVLKRYREAY